MGDEIIVSDKNRFRTIKSRVEDDVKDRSDWFTRATKNRELRFQKKNTPKPIYENAPNLVEPVVADTIRELKMTIVTTLWQSPRLAQFVGLDSGSVAASEQVEDAFDFHLRRVGKTRARMAQCVDDELMYGHGVAKLVEQTGRGGRPIATFSRCSPLSVIVPTSTLDIADAERVCFIMTFSRGEFLSAAKSRQWDSVAAQAVLDWHSTNAPVPTSSDSGDCRSRFRDGQLPVSSGVVTVWEVYYVSDLGRRVCSFCPDCPDSPLSDRPWTFVALVERGEKEPPLRPWPFVQFRYEDSVGFYDSMGVPEILEGDQKEASCYRTVRGIALDFCGKPFLKGPRRATPFRFKAGEYLDGLEIMWPKTPLEDQVYGQEYARTMSRKRVGALEGIIGSVTSGDQRKTATEINALASTAVGMSTDSVDRFAEPWGEMFSMMWQFMSRDALLHGGESGILAKPTLALSVDAWAGEYAVSTGVSGRTVTQMKTLTSLTNLGQVAPFFENMASTLGAAAVKEFYMWILNTMDSDLARRVMAATKVSEIPHG